MNVEKVVLYVYVQTSFQAANFYGHDDVAERGRKTLLGWVARHGESIHENYNSETGAPLGCRDFSWSAACSVRTIPNSSPFCWER